LNIFDCNLIQMDVSQLVATFLPGFVGLFLLLGLLYLRNKWQKEAAETFDSNQRRAEGNEINVNNAANNQRRAGLRNRTARERLARNAEQIDPENNHNDAAAQGEIEGREEVVEGEEGGEEEEIEGQLGEYRMKKMGKKKAEKLERKEEKRRQREYMEAQREDKKKREELREIERKKRELADQQRLEAEEQAERDRLTEIARKEQEEYLALKSDIVVEAEGISELPAKELRILMDKMATYIKNRKVTLVEELSSEFKLKSTDAAAKLRLLDKQKKIQGVLDDRGRYIYVTNEELENLANHLKERGRFTKVELTKACNKIISLKPVVENLEPLAPELYNNVFEE